MQMAKVTKIVSDIVVPPPYFQVELSEEEAFRLAGFVAFQKFGGPEWRFVHDIYQGITNNMGRRYDDPNYKLGEDLAKENKKNA
jgi:hypothetical protein